MIVYTCIEIIQPTVASIKEFSEFPFSLAY